MSRMKDKNDMIISINAEEIIWQNTTSIYVKTFNKGCIERTYLKIMKAICDKSTANTKLNDKKLKALTNNKKRMPTLTTSIQRIIESPSQSN